MLQTVRLLTLCSSLAAVCFFIFRSRSIKPNFLFFIFCCQLFLNEALMYFTAELSIRNHVIANINTLVYFPLAFLVLFNIWETLKGKTQTIVILKSTFIGLIGLGWLIENFVLNDFLFYNSFLSTIISLFLVIISVYLINVMLFIKSNSIFKDSDGLVLIGVLIRSFSCGLILLFMNYRMKYSDDFYQNVLVLVNLALTISNIFFIFSIICLPQKRKYTWPF